MPQHLVEEDSHARRDVERAQRGVVHRQAHEPVAVAFAEALRNADALAPEDEHGPFRVAHLPQVAPRVGAREERLPELRQRGLERVPRRPDPRLDPLPVVEAGSAHLALVEREAERLDEVQARAGREAGAAGVSRVPVDLGLDERDVEGPGEARRVDGRRAAPAKPGERGSRRRESERRGVDVPRLRPHDLVHLVAGGGRRPRPGAPGEEEVEHRVVDAAPRVEVRPAAEERDVLDLEPRLLAGLAGDRVLEPLVHVDEPAGEAEEAAGRLVRPAQEQHAAVRVLDDQAGGHRRVEVEVKAARGAGEDRALDPHAGAVPAARAEPERLGWTNRGTSRRERRAGGIVAHARAADAVPARCGTTSGKAERGRRPSP